MTEYDVLDALLSENLYLKKELEDKERIINNYRTVFEQRNAENQKQGKPSLIDRILDHLPKWIFKEEEE